MKNSNGDEIVALAATIAIEITKDKDVDELKALLEFLHLLRQNIEIIKCRQEHCCKDFDKHHHKH